MGAIHHRIATANQDAQKFFDQGLALVYAFNFGEAINSFQRAAELGDALLGNCARQRAELQRLDG